MKKRSIIAAAGLAAASIIGAIAPSNTASAGEQERFSVFVNLEVYAPDAVNILDGLTVEVWDIGTTPPTAVSADCDEVAANGEGLVAIDFIDCAPTAAGDYALGLSGVPSGATTTAGCSDDFVDLELIPGDDAQFSLTLQDSLAECRVVVAQPAVIVDKVVADGDADPGDFTIEVYDDSGSLVAEGTDTSADLCGQGLPLTNCAVIALPAGSYQLGEAVAPGYTADNVGCFAFVPDVQRPSDVFPSGVGEFTLGDDPNEEVLPFAQCEITNRYYEGDLVVTKSVTNDDGGTLGPADFTAEVYTEPGGSLVDSGECDAEGDCGTWTLPIGDYRIGEADTNGYTPSVTCTVTGEPDGPAPITTDGPELILEEREAIAGDDAVATVEPFGEVTCEIVNDDPTTTTIAPTTTDQGGGAGVPTTVAPTLPPTGDSNGTIAALAALFIALGGSLLVARRRTA